MTKTTTNKNYKVEKNFDFRSGTTTCSTPRMREAAAKAAVGDMGYGEDPTGSELKREDIEAFLEGPALLM
jgi:threonine aldolase